MNSSNRNDDLRNHLAKAVGNTAFILVLNISGAFIVSRVDFILGCKLNAPEWSTLLGGILITLGAFLRGWASCLFYQNELKVLQYFSSQKKLITEGLYRHSRNPLYLGICLILLGSAILFFSISAMLFAAVNFIGLSLCIRKEEKILESNFGETYLLYKKSTPRWLL